MHILGVFLICFQYYTQTTSAFSRQNFVRVATFRKPVFWKEQNDYSFVLNVSLYTKDASVEAPVSV